MPSFLLRCVSIQSPKLKMPRALATGDLVREKAFSSASRSAATSRDETNVQYCHGEGFRSTASKTLGSAGNKIQSRQTPPVRRIKARNGDEAHQTWPLGSPSAQGCS